MSYPLRRRGFCRSLAAAPLVAAAAPLVAAAEADGPPPRVDCHLHCFGGPDPKFPYHRRAPYRPPVAATPEHLLKCMDGAGVDYAIVVHPEPYQDDHRYLEHCLKKGKGRLKGTVLLFSDRGGSLEQLPKLVKQFEVVAVRVHAYAPDRLPPFGKPELRQLWRMASEFGLAVQLHFEPRYAAGFEPLIREFRDTRVIIDHLGRPFQGTPKEHSVVVNWAKFPNTVMKLSSIPDQKKYPHRDIRPVVRQLAESFGADRMIYGGGFHAEATGDSYRAAFERARALIAHLPASDQGKILGATAKRLFQFGG
jgi:predicted TIM-barrel fold metal-dependent hydrolase